MKKTDYIKKFTKITFRILPLMYFIWASMNTLSLICKTNEVFEETMKGIMIASIGSSIAIAIICTSFYLFKNVKIEQNINKKGE